MLEKVAAEKCNRSDGGHDAFTAKLYRRQVVPSSKVETSGNVGRWFYIFYARLRLRKLNVQTVHKFIAQY